MFVAFQVATLVLIALALTPALAHALEFPGKLRLSERTYLVTQAIYYPGFTFVGIAEPLAAIVLVVAAALWPGHAQGFWLTIAAAVSMAGAHAIYWLVTHPVNKVWLKDLDLRDAGKTFFETASRELGDRDWQKLRDRWEYSHVARAACVSVAFICFAVAVAAY